MMKEPSLICSNTSKFLTLKVKMLTTRFLESTSIGLNLFISIKLSNPGYLMAK